MAKFRIIALLFLALIVGVVLAQEDEFDQARKLINSQVSCDSLTKDQIELIGDYVMDQMHPGDAHEKMEDMMGGEGSDALRAMHLQMGKDSYCAKASMTMDSKNLNEQMPMMKQGMMMNHDMMKDEKGRQMNDAGMGMGGMGMKEEMMDGAMMGGPGNGMKLERMQDRRWNSPQGRGSWYIFNALSLILLLGLVLAVWLWAIKLWMDIRNKSNRK